MFYCEVREQIHHFLPKTNFFLMAAVFRYVLVLFFFSRIQSVERIRSIHSTEAFFKRKHI